MFLVGVCETRFPSNRSRTLWTSSPAVLPAPLRGDARDLPQLAGYDKAALDAYRQDTRAHDQEEELRLGYVAFTRAAHRLSVTSYLWSPRSTPFGPSPYQAVVRDQLEAWGEPLPDGHWLEKPVKGDPNPYDAVDPSRPWPEPGPGREAALRLQAAQVVRRGRPDGARRGPRRDRGGAGRRLGPRARPSRGRGPGRPRPGRRRAAADLAVGDGPVAAAHRAGGVRPRAGPADAAAAVAGGPLRHPVPRLGRGPVRPAGPLRPRRAARPGRRRHRLRRRPRRPDRDVRARPVRRPRAARRRGAVRAGPRRPGGARPDRRGVRRARRLRRLPGRRLEDQPQGRRRRRCSSPSTGWPGPSWPAYPSSGCGRRSTSCAADASSSPTTCPAATELEGMLSPL